MSCFICADETISLLADLIADQLNYGYNYTGLDAPFGDFDGVFNTCRINGEYKAKSIYKVLFAENCKAYDGRYNKNTTAEYAEVNGYKPTNIIKSRENSKKWYLTAYKKLGCYTYQLAEDLTIDGDIYRVLTTFEHMIAGEIICNMPEYDEIAWG